MPNHEFYKDVLLECERLLQTYQENDRAIQFGSMILNRAYQSHKDDPSIQVMPWKIFNSIGTKDKISHKIGYNYQYAYKGMVDIPKEAYALHLHTHKRKSRKQMLSYSSPQDILDRVDQNTFAKYCSKYVDDHMMKFNWHD